jgi:hypothetical protein
MPPPLFMLAVFGRHGDVQAKLSAYDMERGSKALVEAINAELGGVTREGTKQMVRAAADAILRRQSERPAGRLKAGTVRETCRPLSARISLPLTARAPPARPSASRSTSQQAKPQVPFCWSPSA